METYEKTDLTYKIIDIFEEWLKDYANDKYGEAMNHQHIDDFERGYLSREILRILRYKGVIK